jgi:thioredoxin-related protein
MRKLVTVLLCVPFLLPAQETGILFDQSPTWKDVLAKAKAENKYIFIDCYTTWCAPCKSMDEMVFPDKEVATYYNTYFINVKIQFDSTANDNGYVKGWYEDRKFIDQRYKIAGYPSYLFFDPQGNLVHRFTGAMGAKKFVDNAKNVFNPDTQYFTQLSKYYAGKNDPAFLLQLSKLADLSNDQVIAKSAGTEYIASQPDLYTKDNLAFLISLTRSSKDKGFAVLMNEAEKVNAVLGKGKAEAVTREIIWNEEVIYHVLQSVKIVDGKWIVEDKEVNWQALSGKLQSKYPKQAEELGARARVYYYKDRGKWSDFCTAVAPYMAQYGDHVNNETLDEYARAVFRSCTDTGLVSQALEWSKRSFAEEKTPDYISTYANLLHKMGRTREAIGWQKKAIALIPQESDSKWYLEKLGKMEKGEKTW